MRKFLGSNVITNALCVKEKITFDDLKTNILAEAENSPDNSGSPQGLTLHSGSFELSDVQEAIDITDPLVLAAFTPPLPEPPYPAQIVSLHGFAIDGEGLCEQMLIDVTAALSGDNAGRVEWIGPITEIPVGAALMVNILVATAPADRVIVVDEGE